MFGTQFEIMKTITTLDEAMEILKPYYNDIISVMKEGFDDFKKTQEFINENIGFVNLQVRTRTNLIHDFTAQKIVDKFSEADGLEVGVFNRIFGINVEEKLFVRFKKMNKHFAVSNLKTRQHRRFMNQYSIEGLPAESTYLFAGYIPELSWQGVHGIYLACWNGDVLQWIDDAGNRSMEQLTIKLDFTKQSAHNEIEKMIKLKGRVINIKK